MVCAEACTVACDLGMLQQCLSRFTNSTLRQDSAEYASRWAALHRILDDTVMLELGMWYCSNEFESCMNVLSWHGQIERAPKNRHATVHLFTRCWDW